jgi:5-hydroxyisourate hydrolase
MTVAGGISLHAVDVATGQPARGLRVSIHRLDPAPVLVAEGVLGADGALDHPVTQGAGVQAGVHEVLFQVGAFYAGTATPPFLGEVPFRFTVFDPALHYHLPMKFTPWGYALFRGA